MDHLALFDGFAASTSLDLTRLPAAADLDGSYSDRRDANKGKARACEDFDNEPTFQSVVSTPAESSRSGRSLSALSDNTSRLRDSRSADHSDTKGKARQLLRDVHPYASASAADSHPVRRPWTSTSNDTRNCEPSASVSWSCHDSCHDEASRKRSIRQMGSSPSSSPRQPTRPLHAAQACSSTSQFSLNLVTSNASSSSSFPLASASSHAQPATQNKKRRSLRSGGDNQNDTFAIRSEQHTPRAHAAVETLPVDTCLRSERHARRASLLVNSSTRDSLTFAQNPTLGVSTELSDDLSRSEQASSDLSRRRSAYIAVARAQRSNSTVRRRRGFYLRDADLLFNDPSEESLASSSDRPNSSTCDTFTAEFNRAVDLRLATQPDSTQSGAFTSSAVSAPQAGHQQISRGATTQPSAPQLPYPRTASPLAISFAAVEADQLRQEAQLGLTARPTSRRRIPVPVHSAFLYAHEDAAPSAVSSRRTLDDQAYWETSSTQQPERSSGTPPNDYHIFGRHESTQRNNYAWRVEARRADATATTAVTQDSTPDSVRFDARRPYHVQFSAHTALESRTREYATVDDFGAVQRPFGLPGSRLTRRPYRSSAEDSPETGPSAAAEAMRVHTTHLRRDADPSTDRQADEAREQRDSPPHWRRTHFGLSAPSRLPERHVAISTAQPRFEPAAEGPTWEPRRSTGLVSSRGSPSTSLYRGRHENESALDFLGRLMSLDSMLDDLVARDAEPGLFHMAFESGRRQTHPHPRHLGHTPASTSSTFVHSPHLAFDPRNFIADEDWANYYSYERLVQLDESLGAVEISVPQSLIDTLPTCEYGKWDGGSCRQGDALSASPPLVGKGKGKQKVEPPTTSRDTMCPICREDYLDSDMLMSLNNCCHAFHADCIKTWFKKAKTCPLCRADAFDNISLPVLPFESSSSSITTTADFTAPGTFW